MDARKYTSIIFIDLEMEFDTVDHAMLLQKLTLYGILDKELKWFPPNLGNRKQCCKVNGFLSKIEDIKYRVPQGSCLEPLLFLLYINDLHLALKNRRVTVSADVTSICFASGSVDDTNRAINKDLEDHKIWLESNRLSLNVLKTQRMLTGTSKRLQKLQRETSTNPSF